MKFAIISSTLDIASITIKDSLLKLFDFEKTGSFEDNEVYKLKDKDIVIYTTNAKLIHFEDADKKIDADFFVFISKHVAKSGVPSLTVHAIGNWDKAEYGGRDRKLCIAPALYLREAILKLEELGKDAHYDIIQEVTHHGPYLEKPVMFIEIGSNEEEWKKSKSGDIIAETVMHILSKEPEKCKTAFGIGGLHHMPNFKKVYKKGLALSHVCPKHMLQYLDEEMLKQALEKTTEKIDFVLLDWKGMAQEKNRIIEILDKLGLEYKKTREF